MGRKQDTTGDGRKASAAMGRSADACPLQRRRPRRGFLGCFAVLLVFVSAACPQEPFLSNLWVGAEDPLFATYAAAMERSEFLVDEAYHFRYYDPEEALRFDTDSGGSIGLAFWRDGRLCYRLAEYAVRPMIEASYSDMVVFRCRPFPKTDVRGTFYVVTSRSTLLELAIHNEGTDTAEIVVFPFLARREGFREAATVVPDMHFTARHEERPDGWTLAHGVPYRDELWDLWLGEPTPDRVSAYADFGSVAPPLRKRTTVASADLFVHGKIRHSDGSLCRHRPPEVQLNIFGDQFRRLWTEEIPGPWGGSALDGSGRYGAPVDFAGSDIGDTLQILFGCVVTGEGIDSTVVLSAASPAGSLEVDLQLRREQLIPAPSGISVHFSSNRTGAVITWRGSAGMRYWIYRRTSGFPGRYTLLQGNVDGSGVMDLGLSPDSSYAYVVFGRDAAGRWTLRSQEVGSGAELPFLDDARDGLLQGTWSRPEAEALAFQYRLRLPPGEVRTLHLVRAVTDAPDGETELLQLAEEALAADLAAALRGNEERYSRVPRLMGLDPDLELMYWSAFNMMRQCFLPPEGECSHPYYVFSREPTWGWGHGGQVFHESLAMLALAQLDPWLAQESQLVYAERMGARPEWPRGYIPYRVGPYLNEVIYTEGQHTSSAPWFSWENWEIFQVSGDTSFLRQAYAAGAAFHDFWLEQRDADGDGLCEWGGHSFLESVRDYNVIWDLVGGWSQPHSASNLEALDLNCELVREEMALASMALALGREEDAARWQQLARWRAEQINRLMWDPETRFYYHVERRHHTFTYRSLDDLKRKEIIGLLPLWAGVAGEEQARALAEQVLDPRTFGAPNGLPLLARDDPYDGYDASSVYPEWNYLVFRGLLEYDFREEAEALANRLFRAVIRVLRDYHDFYESYHAVEPRPSDSWLHTYIWTGIVARMVLDLYGPASGAPAEGDAETLPRLTLKPIFPNPANESVVFEIILPRPVSVDLAVFDVLGRRVATLARRALTAGRHRFRWDGRSRWGMAMPSGVYVARLAAGEAQVTRRFALLR